MALIDLSKLAVAGYSHGIGESRLDYLERENERLRSLLYATARRYNQTYKELESIKEFHGVYKNPLPFLRFPREVRDKIYFYALRAPLRTETRTRSVHLMLWDNGQYPYKPPTPGLVSTNKQVHREAVEILYSRNIFYFQHLRQFLDFEKQIGAVNGDYIRRIQIWVMYPSHGTVVPSPDTIATCDYEEYPSHWAKALRDCPFHNVNEMTIDIECIGSPDLSPMEAPLKGAIEDILSRTRQLQVPRRITLRGFGWNEWKKFPRDIKVITRQWPTD